jgi:hypothetical protein
MMNSKIPHIHQRGETYQYKQKAPATRPRNVVQEKGSGARALSGSFQPGSVNTRSRAETMDTKFLRSQNTNPSRVKLVHTTIWLHPLVRAEMERIAKAEGLSISQVGAIACDEWVRSNIHHQQTALAETKLRQMFREELQAFGHRIVFFLLRIALAAEQARILITNVLKLVLKIGGLYEEKGYYAMVDESAKLAKRNVIKNTPQLKSLHEEWESAFANHTRERKEGEAA